MNNNFIAKIMCLVMAAVMLFTLFGCNKKAEENQDGGVVSINDITDANGDAVLKYEVTDENGEKKEITEKVNAKDIDTPSYQESNIVKRENFASEIAGKQYDMPEEKAKDVVENKEKWEEFNAVEYVQNTSDKHMAFETLSVENNGENGIWVNKQLDAVFTVAPGAMFSFSVWALADTSVLTDDEAIEKAFSETKIKLIYTLVDDPMDDDIDWSKADVKEMVIH